ncbi:MAG: DUF4271 domain-containing protein [Proteiniphilum sp.]|nr:DUF4271 domain-containing protein [Proteiniphilum sp.]
MKQPSIISDSVTVLPSHLMRAEEVLALSDSLQCNFGRFEFLPTDSTRLFFEPDSSPATLSQWFYPAYAGDPLPFSPWVQSLFFLLFLLCILLFAFIYRKEGVSLMGNFRYIFSLGKRTVLFRKEQVTITEAWGEFFLIIQTILMISMLLFFILWNYGISSFSGMAQLITFAAITAAMSLLIGLKIMTYRIIGTFFLLHDLKNWVTQYTRMMELIGIILFLPALCFLFLPEMKECLLILFAVVFLISRLVIITELLNIFVKNKVGWFYFFVYLCGTEIAPWLLLCKGVLSMIHLAGINMI